MSFSPFDIQQHAADKKIFVFRRKEGSLSQLEDEDQISALPLRLPPRAAALPRRNVLLQTDYREPG